MAARTKAHMQAVRQERGKAELLGLNLWCDSVPCNFGRSQSVEAVTIGFLGLPGSHNNIRIPVVGLNKQFMTSESYEDILTILSWCMRAVANCSHP